MPKSQSQGSPFNPLLFTDLAAFSKEEIEKLVELSIAIKKREAPLHLKRDLVKPSVATIFLEPSTRTKMSFELAVQKLGFHLLNFQESSSSFSKGEDLLETILSIKAMGVDTFVLRHKVEEEMKLVAQKAGVCLISGGTGTTEHPTQALLDLCTFQFEKEIQDKKITIVGDIKHSRVAHSWMALAKVLELNLQFVCPAQWQSDDQEFEYSEDLDSTLESTDLLIMLRVQKERHQGDTVSISEITQKFQLNAQRLTRLSPEALIFHPGPHNLNVEITEEVLKDPRTRIREQVSFGVPLRMATLMNACFYSGTMKGTELLERLYE